MSGHPTSLILLLGIGVVCGCGNSESKDIETAAVATISIDAAAPVPLPALPITGSHLDGSGSEYVPVTRPSSSQSSVRGDTIELILRSTPPGATASMDGRVVGVTPTFWSGHAGHKSHDFTFVKKGFSMARYRFVATQNGVVHASLSPLVPGAVKPEAPKN